MAGRQIKSGNASVRCEGDQVVIKGAMVSEETGAAAGISQAEGDARYVQRSGLTRFTVGAVEPSGPVTNDLWLGTD